MSRFALIFSFLAVSLVMLTGCPSSAPVKDEGPPPPQNLIGSTDQLQLVTELSFDLARTHGGENILVVLAIDNTLLSGNGSGETQTMQGDAGNLVQRLQDSGISVIAVSSAAPQDRRLVLDALESNGLEFSARAWPPQQGYAEPFVPDNAAWPVAYERGVYFTAGQNNGEMLKSLLEKGERQMPSLIVMADAEQSNLNAVMKVFTWTNTKVHAWRYTREVPAAEVSRQAGT